MLAEQASAPRPPHGVAFTTNRLLPNPTRPTSRALDRSAPSRTFQLSRFWPWLVARVLSVQAFLRHWHPPRGVREPSPVASVSSFSVDLDPVQAVLSVIKIGARWPVEGSDVLEHFLITLTWTARKRSERFEMRMVQGVLVCGGVLLREVSLMNESEGG